MKTLLFLFTVFSSMGIRYLRWFAYTQQKEYRPDRLWLFIRSEAGRKELIRIIPRKSDFTRLGCKRPAVTIRMLFVMVLTGLLVTALVTGTLLSLSPLSIMVKSLMIIFLVLILIVFAPLFILVAVTPTAAVHLFITRWTARRAQALFRQQKPLVIGITGSFGKSSTKLILAHVLSQKYEVFFTPKSYNTLLSVARSILKGFSKQKIAILEYAAYGPKEIEKLASYFKPSRAVVTGFTPQHLGLFGSADRIIEAKSELVAALAEGDPVYYTDSYHEVAEIVSRGVRKSKAVPVCSQWRTLSQKSTVSNQGTVSFTYQGRTIHSQLIGGHYVENCVLVWQVAQEFLSDAEIQAGLESFVPTEQFITKKRTHSGALVIDDGGSSNPAGFEQALTLLTAIPGKRKVLVTPGIVDLGEQSDAIHARLLEKAKVAADSVVYVGDSSLVIAKEVLGSDGIFTMDEARAVLSGLTKDEVVLLEGKMPGWVLEVLGI